MIKSSKYVKFGCLLVAVYMTQAEAQAPQQTAREAAPFDLTGYWVSVVSEDWRWRMLTAPVGDRGSIPVNSAGQEAAQNWNPEGNARSCLIYGAAGIIRQPGRLRISWQDDETLQLDFSAGNQTRLLHFGEIDNNPQASLQGQTRASWFKQRQTRGLGFGGPPSSFAGGNLHAETRALLPAWLQSNGFPYSAQATMREYFNVHTTPDGNEWLFVTTIVSDPLYLNQDYTTTSNFRRETDGSRWNPHDCE